MNSNGRRLIFVFCFIIPIISGQGTRDQQSICDKQNNSQIIWTCKKIADCKWSSNLIGSRQEYRCGASMRDRKICCPERRNSSTPNTASIPQYVKIINKKCMDFAEARYQNVCRGGDVIYDEEVCTLEKDCKQSVETLVANGKQAALKEFPHMALIGYGNDINSIAWRCGGSLISEKFILTAAHCITLSNLPPKWVGLGLLWRDQFTPSTLNKNLFPIKKVHLHPAYKTTQSNDDIALFELKSAVPFSPNIRPVCLHTQYNIPQEARNNATILGWGTIGVGLIDSEFLLKATLAFLPNESCQKVYAETDQLKNGFDGKTMICAGDIRHKNDDIQDTCQGDSGGPIQMNHKEECMYVQVGVTSLGSKFCGDGTPAIYTRVSAYLEWIQRIVWPQNK